jgi:hypothetical protein
MRGSTVLNAEILHFVQNDTTRTITRSMNQKP